MNQEINEFIKNRQLDLEKIRSLQEEAKLAFEEKLNQLMKEKKFIRRIRVPREYISLWKKHGKMVRISLHWRYLVSAPFIYGMIIPAVIWHAGLEFYHQICFRLYGIPLVNYKEYFIYDRKLLSWLNPWEKINCMYCSYVNNLVRYSSEVGGRTERYWCPIKYYRRISNAHSQYNKFSSESDPKKMRAKWHELRDFSDLT